MGLALLKENEMNGVGRKEFEEALIQLSDIARIAEQRLTVKVDNYINEQYKKQYLAIEEARRTIASR
jgi:hypothetical protein